MPAYVPPTVGTSYQRPTMLRPNAHNTQSYICNLHDKVKHDTRRRPPISSRPSRSLGPRAMHGKHLEVGSFAHVSTCNGGKQRAVLPLHLSRALRSLLAAIGGTCTYLLAGSHYSVRAHAMRRTATATPRASSSTKDRRISARQRQRQRQDVKQQTAVEVSSRALEL